MNACTLDPVTVARQFKYVREAGANRGLRVEAVQHWSGGEPGESWCDDFAIGWVLDICFQGDSPFPRERDIDGSTVAALAYARAQGWIVDAPAPGDLVFSVHPDGTPHHVALYTGQVAPDGSTVPDDQLVTIAGNTDDTGTSSNGDRVAEHPVSRAGKVFVHYPRTGP
jgi:cell wall-associated NlpC family hydrolase